MAIMVQLKQPDLTALATEINSTSGWNILMTFYSTVIPLILNQRNALSRGATAPGNGNNKFRYEK